MRTLTWRILLQSATALTDEYVTTKILELLGDGDKAEYIINQKVADELSRYNISVEQSQQGEAEEETGEEPTENVGEDNA